jgi:hypothetical protein
MKIESIPTAELKFDPANARKHSQINLKSIRESLEKFGQAKPIVITSDNTVVAGNGTLQAAISIGWSKIDCVRVPKDWNADMVKAYALVDNRSAELAEWDKDILVSQLAELEALDFDIHALGFEQIVAQPVDVESEWQNMPEFNAEDKESVFHCTIHFASNTDADNFFELIGVEKKFSAWWPQHDGFVGSTRHQQWVAEDGSN